jgi:hypothetical protein
MFESVVVVVFQSVFYSEMHQNNIFFIFYKLFLTSAHQKHLKTLKKKLSQKKSKFWETQFQTTPKSKCPDPIIHLLQLWLLSLLSETTLCNMLTSLYVTCRIFR